MNRVLLNHHHLSGSSMAGFILGHARFAASFRLYRLAEVRADIEADDPAPLARSNHQQQEGRRI